MLPIIGMPMSVRNSCNQNRLPLDNVSNVARKYRAVYAPVTSRTLSPKMRVPPNRCAYVRNFVPESFAQAGLPRFIEKCSRAQLAPRFLEKLQPHFLRASSSSAKTSSAGTVFDVPSLNFLIRPIISRSQASSMSALIGGSRVAKMRWASVNR